MINVTDKRKEELELEEPNDDLNVIDTNRESKQGCFIFGYQKDYVDKLISRDNALSADNFIIDADSYTVSYICPNCSYHRFIKFKKDISINTISLPRFCERCGQRLMFNNK